MTLNFEANTAGVLFRPEYEVMIRTATTLTLSITIDCPGSSDMILFTYF